MKCPSCRKDVALDRQFCIFCDTFVMDGAVGRRSGFVRRAVALALDLLWATIFLTVAPTIPSLGRALALAMLATYGFLLFFGCTPGKYALGLRVVDRWSGRRPSVARMLLRQTAGKLLNLLPVGLGCLWAILDGDGRAYHHKLARTLVVQRPGRATRSRIAWIAALRPRSSLPLAIMLAVLLFLAVGSSLITMRLSPAPTYDPMWSELRSQQLQLERSLRDQWDREQWMRRDLDLWRHRRPSMPMPYPFR